MTRELRFVRRSFGILAIVAVFALPACGGDEDAAPGETAQGEPAAPAEVREIDYATSFGLFGRDAYAFAALEKGFFEEAGFDVSIVPGAGSVDNARLIAAGQLDYAPIDFSALVVTRANEDIPVKCVSFVHQQTLSAILFKADSGISAPEDLEGRVVADAPGSTVAVMFPLYAANAGVEEGEVTFQPADPPTLPSLLASDQVDAVGQFVVGVPLFEAATQGEVGLLPYADFLPELPGICVAASDDKIEKDPDEVERFVAALNRGLEDALENPADAATILNESQPETDPAVAEEELVIMRDFVLNEDTEEHGVGYMDPAQLDEAIATIAQAFDLETDVTSEDVFAVGFVDE